MHNDFVNPQHRGINLPQGCHDLIEVLNGKKPVSESWPSFETIKKRVPIEKEQFAANGLAQVEKYLFRFLSLPSGMSNLAFLPKRGEIAFLLFCMNDFRDAIFSFSEGDVVQEKAVCKVFAESGIAPGLDSASNSSGSERWITYPLPPDLTRTLKMVTDILRQAYGISDADGLGFISWNQ